MFKQARRLVVAGDEDATLTNNVTANPPGLILSGLITEVQKVVHEECGIALSREAALDVLILGCGQNLAEGEPDGVTLSPSERAGLKTLVVAGVSLRQAS